MSTRRNYNIYANGRDNAMTKVDMRVVFNECTDANGSVAKLFNNQKAQLAVTVYLTVNEADAEVEGIQLAAKKLSTNLMLIDDKGTELDPNSEYPVPEQLSITKVGSVNERQFKSHPDNKPCVGDSIAYTHSQTFLVETTDKASDLDQLYLMGWATITGYIPEYHKGPDKIHLTSFMQALNSEDARVQIDNCVLLSLAEKPALRIYNTFSPKRTMSTAAKSKLFCGQYSFYAAHNNRSGDTLPVQVKSYSSSVYKGDSTTETVDIHPDAHNFRSEWTVGPSGEPPRVVSYEHANFSGSDWQMMAVFFHSDAEHGAIRILLANETDLWYEVKKGDALCTASYFYGKDTAWGRGNQVTSLDHTIQIDVTDWYGDSVKYRAKPWRSFTEQLVTLVGNVVME